MKKKKSKLQLLQDEAQASINETNKKIEILGKHSYALCTELNTIQMLFDEIRNVPSTKKYEVETLRKIRINWKRQAKKIEKDYENAAIKNAGAGVAGVGVGVAVATLGPTAAMGIATTFGVASTGTAISTLSGAAATNAALAWLGGGALTAGGGGMVAGNAFLALAGPVGWAISSVVLFGSSLLFWKSAKEKKRIENIFTLISKRDIKSYKLAIVELNERIIRIDNESKLLKNAIKSIKSFGSDYNSMSEEQRYELGSYINLMHSSTQLLLNPIKGLLPKFTEEHWNHYWNLKNRKVDDSVCKTGKSMIISLANLLYKIEIDDKDKQILLKFYRKDKKMLKAMNMKKKEMTIDIIESVEEALSCIY